MAKGSVSQVRGAWPDLFTKNFFGGKHAQRAAFGEALGTAAQYLTNGITDLATGVHQAALLMAPRATAGSSVNSHWNGSYADYVQRRGISQ
jgi:hypothetical protein